MSPAAVCFRLLFRCQPLTLTCSALIMAGHTCEPQSLPADPYADRLKAAHEYFGAKFDPVYDALKARTVRRQLELRPGRAKDFTPAQIVSGPERC